MRSQRRKLTVLRLGSHCVNCFHSSCFIPASSWDTQGCINSSDVISDHFQGDIMWLFRCSQGRDTLTCLLWWEFWSSPSFGSGSLWVTSYHWLSPQHVSSALTRILRYAICGEKSAVMAWETWVPWERDACLHWFSLSTSSLWVPEMVQTRSLKSRQK